MTYSGGGNLGGCNKCKTVHDLMKACRIRDLWSQLGGAVLLGAGTQKIRHYVAQFGFGIYDEMRLWFENGDLQTDDDFGRFFVYLRDTMLLPDERDNFNDK